MEVAWKCFYAVSYTAGLRYGETINPTADNLDLEKKLIIVRNRPATPDTSPFHVKSEVSREVPVPGTTVRLVSELLGSIGKKDRYVLLPQERNVAIAKK